PQDIATLEKQQIKQIDLVAVSLYPFEETVANPETTLEEAIEQIDIGGVSLLRAAAKNFKHVVVVPEPDYYDEVLTIIKSEESEEELLLARKMLAGITFANTAHYDRSIMEYLEDISDLEDEASAADEQYPDFYTPAF